MSFRFHLGPPQISINHGQTVLVTDPDGSITPPGLNGLYFADTRLISEWGAYANGESWDVRTSSLLSYRSSTHFLSNREFLTEAGVIKPANLILQITRSIHGGMHEDLEITNYSDQPLLRFRFEVALQSDFVDLLELKLGTSKVRGLIAAEWHLDEQKLRIVYENKSLQPPFVREFVIHVRSAAAKAVYANGRLAFDLRLQRGETWHACLLYKLIDSAQPALEPPTECFGSVGSSSGEAKELAWRNELSTFAASSSNLAIQFRQSVEDISALRLTLPEIEQDLSVPAAGIPWFATVFGRDSLIASMQYLLVDQRFARGTLAFLEKYQGSKTDNLHDEQPGRILHELRYGEPAKLKLNLFTPYYGTADATSLFIIGLHATWQWSGDIKLLQRHLPAAEKCLRWIDECGDRDGDGIQEYLTQSEMGYENLGWKDSFDSVVDQHGTIVTGVKAINELQGYTYDAWLRMAEIYEVLGDGSRARQLRGKAKSLYGRFNDQFWDDALGCYAYGLDAKKQKIRAVSSDMGHCLWSGIVPHDRAVLVAHRLMQPDLSSGWGIRTLSALNPAFNPFSYHNGSVWPHDNSLIANGFRRYDLVTQANQVLHDVSDAATHFQYNQLPEFYAGIHRKAGSVSNLTGSEYSAASLEATTTITSDFPVQCFQASAPQAWAAGSTFLFLQTMLGLHPDAQNRTLYVDPQLPHWLTEARLSKIKVGHQEVSLRFWRDNQQTRFERVDGNVNVVYRRFSEATRLGHKE